MTTENIGALAAALAKAQTEFATVTRDKTVTVTTKSSGSYTFSYAPLDTILAAVREPLSKNGLAVVQMLDDGGLVTTLMHESGGAISGRIDLPHTENVQALGSAITYLRRYAIQAVLGIAAEDDDDGNNAAGNQATPTERPRTNEEKLDLLGDITRTGTIAKGDGRNSNLEARETPDGHHIGFRLDISKDAHIPQVVAEGAIGRALFVAAGTGGPESLVGTKAKVTGRLFEVRVQGRRAYHRLVLTRIETDEWVIPADDPPPAEAESVPLFDPAESARLDAEEAARQGAAA